jgi:hypothetical protein
MSIKISLMSMIFCMKTDFYDDFYFARYGALKERGVNKQGDAPALIYSRPTAFPNVSIITVLIL